MNSIRKERSNYSLFLLSLLLIEFMSFFFRANGLPNLGIMVRVAIFAFIIFNFFVVFLHQFFNRTQQPKIIFWLVIFWVYTLWVYFLNNSFDLLEVMNLTAWVAIFYLFYYYGFPTSTKAMLNVVSAFMVILSVLYYIYALNNGYVGDKPGVVNAIYYLVFCLPFIILKDGKLFRYLMLIVVAVLAVLSKKSTAVIIILATIFLVYLFVNKGEKKSTAWILGSCLTFGFTCFLISSFAGIDILTIFNDDVDKSGNGRFEIWEYIFQVFNQGPIFKRVFGYGLNFSVNITGLSAHCDYIEILASFGILGFAIFAKWFVCFIKVIPNNWKKTPYLSGICLVILAQVVLIMLFSTSVFISSYFLLLMALFGMTLNGMIRQNPETVL